jgi:hypothetical protein
VDHTAIRNTVERADRIANRTGGNVRIALSNRKLGLLHIGSSFGAIRSIAKSLLLGNPDTLLSRYGIRQF